MTQHKKNAVTEVFDEVLEKRGSELDAAREKAGESEPEEEKTPKLPPGHGYYTGRVHSVIFENVPQAFYIIKVKIDGEEDEFGGKREITARGNIPGLNVTPGTWFGFEGKWVKHPEYGRQVEITRAPVFHGTWDAKTIKRVLSAHGVGRLTLQMLHERFGEELAEALSSKEELEDVPGIDAFAAEHIVSRWQQVRAMFQALSLLGEFNLPKQKIDQVWSTFGDGTEAILSEDPWRLVQVDGITFSQADEIALRMGCDMAGLQRLMGALLYVMKARRGMGHLYMLTGDVVTSIRQLVGSVDKKTIATALKAAHAEGLVVLDKKTKPGTVAVYEPWLYQIEKDSAELLLERAETARVTDPDQIRKNTKLLGQVGQKSAAYAKDNPDDLRGVAEVALKEWTEHSKVLLQERQMKAALNALTEPVSVVTGLPGTGKCVVSGTWISTPSGFRTIESFAEGSHPGTAVPLEVPVDTTRGCKSSSAFYDGGVSPTVKITTACGFALEGTPEHPIRVVERGEIVWKSLGDLAEGDVPLLVRGTHYSFGEDISLPQAPGVDPRAQRFHFPTHMSTELASLLGYLISEGSTLSHKTLVVSAHDRRIQDHLRKVIEELFGYDACVERDSRYAGQSTGVRIHSTQIIKWLRSVGLKPATAQEKEIPWSVLCSSRPCVAAFLRSLFEGDGCVDPNRKTVEYGTGSRGLAEQVHLLLLAFGVVASKLEVERGGKPYWRLEVYGEDYEVFRQRLGFDFTLMPPWLSETCNTNRHLIYGAHEDIRSLMDEVKPPKGPEYNLFYRYAIPPSRSHSRRPSRRKLRQLLAKSQRETAATRRLRALTREDVFYDPIVKIETGVSQVYDFTIPDGHEFLGNGFISHNTFTLRTVVKVLQDAEVPFLLVAPTGIAAKRVMSVTGAEASTIHRAFQAQGMDIDDARESTYAGIVGDSAKSAGADGSSESWGFDQDSPHPAEVIIVDESSMVDQHLLFRLLNCTAKTCRVVFVGDAAQLPSVGPGNVLRDIIESGVFPVTRLSEIYRQQDTSDIILAAHAINQGEVPEPTPGRKEFMVIPCHSEDDILEKILFSVSKLYKGHANFQVLSPRHAGTLGVTNLNARMRGILNPKSPGIQEMRLGKETIREGDRAMVVKNNYQYEIFNGDVGKIMQLDRKEKKIKVKIWGPPEIVVELPFKEAPSHLRLAYAMTVHKSQGQEYDVIVMPWVNGFRNQLQRNLIYTAITRAKKKVILFGHPDALGKAVLNNEVQARNTLFPERLRGKIERS